MKKSVIAGNIIMEMTIILVTEIDVSSILGLVLVCRVQRKYIFQFPLLVKCKCRMY